MSKMSSEIRPATGFKINLEKVIIYLFGRPHDFSSQNIATRIETLKFYASKHMVMNIFSPFCERFNSKIVYKKNFPHKIILDDGLKMHRGVFADGVIMENRQEAFFVPSADCPTIVVAGKHIVIGAHAGRDSLLDRKKIHLGSKSKKHNSVVDAIIERCLLAGEKIKDLQVFITCGIKAENFRHPIGHPQYGEKNKILIEHLLQKYGDDCLRGRQEEGLISLEDLIKRQFVLHSVPPENIATDGIDTYGDYVLNEYRWHSCARGKTPREKKGRNGVLVIPKF